ncbi:MAG TPA: M28 family peptidase [Candidatus Thermoplasmatota archaeon]|nr:M28 family peptidase [Candidatus Thermoplasmatota archaeon]
MRKALALLALVPLLAGCISGKAPVAVPVFPIEAPKVDAAAVLSDLAQWSAAHPLRVNNQPDHENVRLALAAQFRSSGLDVWRQDFTAGIPQANIVGIKWGEARGEWVVVGAHYDVVPTPGCVTPPAQTGQGQQCAPGSAGSVVTHGTYDDGSGTMLMMHLAQAYAKVPTRYSIAFAAFDGEERGLQGSRNLTEAIVDGATPYANVTVRAMLDLDMFGLNWPGVDSPIYFDDNSPELKATVQAMVARLHMPPDMILYQGIGLGRSDYDSFFNIGVPTGFFISDFERYQLPADAPANMPDLPVQQAKQAYPFWHREDTYETMRLMAGSDADLQSGFQTAADLSSGLLFRMAIDPAPLTAVQR